MHVLVAPDKLKGSITAIEAAHVLADGFTAGLPGATMDICPVADGGEGTDEILCNALGGRFVTAPCTDPIGRSIEGRYALVEREEGPMAIIACAQASGLGRLTADERDPLRASTLGTGQLVRDAALRGATRIIVGAGGSATNDGGMGLAVALGARFLDRRGSELAPSAQALTALVDIDLEGMIALPPIVVATDVDNPLLGPRGATRVYARQKGATAEDESILEQALERLADVAAHGLHFDGRGVPGAGAAGGLGFGLAAFCRAELQPGFSLVAELLDLKSRIVRCDLVLTAEGRLDATTLAGKAPGALARLARIHDKPVVVFAGSIRAHPAVLAAFDHVHPLLDRPMSLAQASSQAPRLLRDAAERVASSVARFQRRDRR